MYAEVVLSCLVVVLGLFGYERLAPKLGMLSYPDELSLHRKATPLGAGIIFASVWLLLSGWLNSDVIGFNLIWLPLLLISFAGYIDDIVSLTPKVRLFSQILAAIFVYQFIGYPDLPWIQPGAWLSRLFFFLVFIWTVNLYNFMDGSDGYASVQGVFIFFLFSIMAYFSGLDTIFISSLCMMLYLIIFLYWNYPPASLFMGDVGSTFLGGAIAVHAFYFDVYQSYSWVYPYILLMPFTIDATLSLFRKLYRGLSWSDRHQQHAFQRLLASGVTKQGLLWCQMLLLIVLGLLLASAMLLKMSLLKLIALACFLVVVVYLKIEMIWPESCD